MKKSTITSFLILFVLSVSAQIDIFEKPHDISRKARKGYLGAIESNKEKNTFDLTYVLKSTNNKVIIENYTFDKDLNLINTQKEEEEVEKVRKRYKWFRFRGEEYESKSIYVRGNMKGEMIFREKTVLYKWSWWRGGYAKKINLGEKIKPKDETTGDRYMYRGGYYEDDMNGKLMVLAGLKEGKDYVVSFKNYQIIQLDAQANITVKADIKFSTPNAPIFSQLLEDDDPSSQDENPRDWILIFAPQGGKTYKGVTLENAGNYTYVRISPNGEIKEKYIINTPVAGWRILGALEKNGQVYLYGPSINKDTRYCNEIFNGPMIANTTNEDAASEKAPATKSGFGGMFKTIATIASGEAFQITQEEIDSRLDEMKYTNFQVAALKNGKQVFISSPTIDDINAKIVVPTGQKKEIEFDGKRFVTTNLQVTSSGDIFICGQDYKMSSGVKVLGMGGDKHRMYQGMFMLQFDAQGQYKRNYGLKLDHKGGSGFSQGLTPNMIPAQSTIEESSDGKKIYWLVSLCKAVDRDVDIDVSYGFMTKTTTTTTSFTPLYSVQYGTIDIASGTTTDFKTLGEDENRKFYLMQDLYNVRLGNYYILLSETVKGDKILLSRFDFTK
jgi:hypothetical protein